MPSLYPSRSVCHVSACTRPLQPSEKTPFPVSPRDQFTTRLFSLGESSRTLPAICQRSREGRTEAETVECVAFCPGHAAAVTGLQTPDEKAIEANSRTNQL